MIGTTKDISSLIIINSQLQKVHSQALLLRSLSPTKKQVEIGHYIYDPEKDRIGEGYCSEVFKAVQTIPPYKTFALKKIDMRYFRDTNMEFMQSEVSLHKRLNHPNIIKFIEVIKTQNYYYIILEYCSQGTLEDYIKKQTSITQNKAIEIMAQIVVGCKYLISEDILHRDLKPSNILKQGKTWKISDFGFAIKTKFGFKGKTNVGTPLYMAPETLSTNFYSFKSDFFALGVIMYQILTKNTPWPSGNENQLLQKMKSELVLPQNIKHQKIRQFIIKSTQINESKRMSLEQFLAFDFEYLNGQKQEKRSSNSQMSTNLNSRALQNDIEKNSIAKLKMELMFVEHLLGCLRNFKSFLFEAQTKTVFLLAFYKIIMRQLKSITDKKLNHFELRGWKELQLNPSFAQIQEKAGSHIKQLEKEYIDLIKNNELKTIRIVNRKFPELSHSAPLNERFYESLKSYSAFLIRQHNHQLIKVNIDSQDQKKQFIRLYSDKIQALQSLFQIYRYCDFRIKPKQTLGLQTNPFKVMPLQSESKYTIEDYFDLNRLINNL